MKSEISDIAASTGTKPIRLPKTWPHIIRNGDVAVKIYRNNAHTPELYRQKCSALFEHVYESYPERDTGVYAE